MLCVNLEGCDGVGGVREVQDGGDTHIPLTDSCQYMAETNTISQSTYPLIKNKEIKKYLRGEKAQ